MNPSLVRYFPGAVFVRRQDEHLWFVYGTDDPSRFPLPSVPLLDNKLDNRGLRSWPGQKDRLVPVCWDPAAPWLAFTPTPPYPIPMDWDWVFTSELNDVVEIRTAGISYYRVSSDSLEAGREVARLTAAMIQHIEPHAGRQQRLARSPIAPQYLTAEEAQKDVAAWKAFCLDCLAYATYRQRQLPVDLDKPALEDRLEKTFYRWFIRKMPRRGVVFYPPTFGRANEQEWHSWIDEGLPVAHSWDDNMAADAALNFLNPKVPRAFLKITNANDPGPRKFAEILSSRDAKAYTLPEHWRERFEKTYRSISVVSAEKKINLQVFLLDCPKDDPGADSEILTRPHPFHPRQPLDLTLFLPRPLMQYSSDESDREQTVRPAGGPSLAERLQAPLPPRRRETHASSRPTNDGSTPRPPTRADLTRRVREEILDEVRERKLFVGDDGGVMGEEAVGGSTAFANACRLEFGPATELVLLEAHLASTVSDRGLVWGTMLRVGLPFKPSFTEAFGSRYRDAHREADLESLPVLPFAPSWTIPLDEGPVASPHLARADFFCVTWMRNVERIRAYPQLQRLLCYGGLVWRLVVLLLGRPAVTRVASGPSKVWTTHVLQASGDPLKKLHSEVYDNPANDPLVVALLGQFDRGSLWPSCEVFVADRGYNAARGTTNGDDDDEARRSESRCWRTTYAAVRIDQDNISGVF
ncbi:hypothetical protein PsYK624_172570 [Phanerochaete sordida]|uniref:Uncharacterized protein n=1 Tax=Phanerochaete sordida TaxID=48140 RepID=A0A9P3GS91_9APHY|nr:hypothetical protein PsYK624_172570 [Phanerochaete sordida]